VGCNSEGTEECGTVLKQSFDLPELKKQKKITVLFDNNILSYFNYRGKDMGFEYELLNEFAKEMGLTLEVKLLDNRDSIIQQLNNGSVDLLSCNMTLTRERGKLINFSLPLYNSPQVLVQRKSNENKAVSTKSPRIAHIKDPSQLAKKKVYVWKNSSFYRRLIHLQEEIGDSIYIVPQNGEIGTEELIEMVADGEIDYTISEQNMALLNQRFYENLDVSLPVSIKQNIVFGVRKNSPILLTELNKWLLKFKKTERFADIKSKYFELKNISTNTEQFIATVIGGKLSVYDEIFKREAAKYKIDWRLMASIAFQESRFNPNAIGVGGAFGIMQFMPSTGRKYGVRPSSRVEDQIAAAAQLLSKFYESWNDVQDTIQRQKFTLASYNAGRSHVEDAQRLARKYRKNPLIWDGNVGIMFRNLSKQKYYRDRVVKNGAARGWHTCNYVQNIHNRYMEWRKLTE